MGISTTTQNMSKEEKLTENQNKSKEEKFAEDQNMSKEEKPNGAKGKLLK